MENEIWKTIPGHEDYKVSNLGKVMSFKRSYPIELSQIQSTLYLMVSLDGNIKYVHQLVLLAFVGECPEGMQACHNDCNARNNRLSNLRYDTPENNRIDTQGRNRKLLRKRMRSMMRELYNGNMTDVTSEYDICHYEEHTRA